MEENSDQVVVASREEGRKKQSRKRSTSRKPQLPSSSNNTTDTNHSPRKSVSFGLYRGVVAAAQSTSTTTTTTSASNIRRSVSAAAAAQAETTSTPEIMTGSGGGGGNRIAELKAKLRSSIHEGSRRKSQQARTWNGKDWEDPDPTETEATEDEDWRDEQQVAVDDDLLLNSETFKKSFRRNTSFWSESNSSVTVTKELKDKNQSLETAGDGTNGSNHGVSKRRLANLKGLLQQGVLDQVDTNNIQQAKHKSEDSNEDGGGGAAADGGGGGNLLSLLVKASKDTVKRKQLLTGRLYTTTNKLQQKRYQRAALKLQRFFKQSLHLIRKYRLDRRYLKADIKDVRKRGQQQLGEIQEWVEIEKQKFKLEIAQEYAQQARIAKQDWERYQQQAACMEQEIEEWKQINTTLRNDVTKETRRQEQLELEAQNPERLALEAQIQRLQQDERDWKDLAQHYESATTKTNEQIEAVTKHFFAQKNSRKRTTKTIRKIITDIQESPDDNEEEFVEKLRTLKTKKDAKYARLKEARSNGEYPIPTEEELQTTLAEQYQKETLYFDEVRKLEQERKERLRTALAAQQAAADDDQKASQEHTSTNKSESEPIPSESNPQTPPSTITQESTSESQQPREQKEPPAQEKKEHFEDLYELGELLGEGEFGAVYKCLHKASRNERAVKILDKLYMDQWEYESVIKEFEMLSAVDNPNCIQVYEFYDVQEKFYIVQELAKGGELYDELISKGRLPEQDVATIMRSILSCVQHLASSNICHRDLNLENVLLGGGGGGDGNSRSYQNCKVIDFGLAAECPEGERLYEMVGKARYIAPEVLGDSGYGLKNDVWSCGVTAYTLLAGFCPFEAEYDVDVYPLIEEGYVDLKDPVWNGISDQAKDLVSKLLTHKEEDRPTAAEALQHPWFTNNNSGITFSPDATPAPQVVWTASSVPTVTATAAVAEVKLATVTEEQEEPTQSTTSSQGKSKKTKKKRKSKLVKLEEDGKDVSESFDSGADVSESFHTDGDAPCQTQSLPEKVEFAIDAIDPVVVIHGSSDTVDTTVNSSSGPLRPTSNHSLGSRKSNHSDHSGSRSSSKSKKKAKQKRRQSKKIAKKEKAEEEQVAELLRKRANKINNSDDTFSKMLFSGANHGTKKTALPTHSGHGGGGKKPSLKGAALLKGAVKNVMGRQRRVSALQMLMTAGSKSDDESDSSDSDSEESDTEEAAQEKNSPPRSTTPTTSLRNKKGSGKPQERRASALMSLITNLDDLKEGEAPRRRVGAGNVAG